MANSWPPWAIGGCRSVDACLKSPANPFRASDPVIRFWADCADLPYFLRFYYAWKRGLAFLCRQGFPARLQPAISASSAGGNFVSDGAGAVSRAGADALAVMNRLRDGISSATYRIDPELEAPLAQSFILRHRLPGEDRPGTVIYDPNGHLAVVFRVERNGRIHYIDAHPDNSLTRGTTDLRFVRASPGMGAGFRNWRPPFLEGARRRDGVLLGGRVALAANRAIPDFALTQYFGTGPQPEEAGATARSCSAGTPPRLLRLCPRHPQRRPPAISIRCRRSATWWPPTAPISHYRAEAVDIALAAGLQEPRPARAATAQHLWHRRRLGDLFHPIARRRLKTAFKASARYGGTFPAICGGRAIRA